MPELRHLEYLVAIAEEGTFSAAADSLHVTQPALTRTIKRMEEHILSPIRTGVNLIPQPEQIPLFCFSFDRERISAFPVYQASCTASFPEIIGNKPF